MSTPNDDIRLYGLWVEYRLQSPDIVRVRQILYLRDRIFSRRINTEQPKARWEASNEPFYDTRDTEVSEGIKMVKAWAEAVDKDYAEKGGYETWLNVVVQMTEEEYQLSVLANDFPENVGKRVQRIRGVQRSLANPLERI